MNYVVKHLLEYKSEFAKWLVGSDNRINKAFPED